MGETILRMHGIQKFFPGVHALNNAQLEVLESGRVVYSDFSTDVKNKSLNYRISGSTPGADYSVRVMTDGVLRVWEYVPVGK